MNRKKIKVFQIKYFDTMQGIREALPLSTLFHLMKSTRKHYYFSLHINIDSTFSKNSRHSCLNNL